MRVCALRHCNGRQPALRRNARSVCLDGRNMGSKMCIWRSRCCFFFFSFQPHGIPSKVASSNHFPFITIIFICMKAFSLVRSLSPFHFYSCIQYWKCSQPNANRPIVFITCMICAAHILLYAFFFLPIFRVYAFLFYFIATKTRKTWQTVIGRCAFSLRRHRFEAALNLKTWWIRKLQKIYLIFISSMTVDSIANRAQSCKWCTGLVNDGTNKNHGINQPWNDAKLCK